jgi:CDGSH-type Zn-finger protein
MTQTPRPTRPATVKAIKDGPLQLKGGIRLLDPQGEEYDTSGQFVVLLCRCGRSKNLPFCDSSHTSSSFVTDDQPATREEEEADGEGVA